MEQLLDTVCDIATDAGELIMDYYQSREFDIATKSHQHDYVTTADQEADTFIRERLTALCVGETILSEETDTFPESFEGDVWIVDPIDGTYSFVHQTGMFATMIGLARNGKPALGVIHFPALSKTYMAYEGGGAYLQQGNTPPVRLQVSDTNDLDHATIRVSGSVYRRGLTDYINRRQQYCKSLDQNKGRNRFGDLVEGTIDAYMYPIPNGGLRDVCAPTVIVQEANGSMTQRDGKPVHFSANQPTISMIATNGHIHNSLLKMIATFDD